MTNKTDEFELEFQTEYRKFRGNSMVEFEVGVFLHNRRIPHALIFQAHYASVLSMLDIDHQTFCQTIYKDLKNNTNDSRLLFSFGLAQFLLANEAKYAEHIAGNTHTQTVIQCLREQTLTWRNASEHVALAAFCESIPANLIPDYFKSLRQHNPLPFCLVQIYLNATQMPYRIFMSNQRQFFIDQQVTFHNQDIAPLNILCENDQAKIIILAPENFKDLIAQIPNFDITALPKPALKKILIQLLPEQFKILSKKYLKEFFEMKLVDQRLWAILKDKELERDLYREILIRMFKHQYKFETIGSLEMLLNEQMVGINFKQVAQWFLNHDISLALSNLDKGSIYHQTAVQSFSHPQTTNDITQWHSWQQIANMWPDNKLLSAASAIMLSKQPPNAANATLLLTFCARAYSSRNLTMISLTYRAVSEILQFITEPILNDAKSKPAYKKAIRIALVQLEQVTKRTFDANTLADRLKLLQNTLKAIILHDYQKNLRSLCNSSKVKYTDDMKLKTNTYLWNSILLGSLLDRTHYLQATLSSYLLVNDTIHPNIENYCKTLFFLRDLYDVPLMSYPNLGSIISFFSRHELTLLMKTVQQPNRRLCSIFSTLIFGNSNTLNLVAKLKMALSNPITCEKLCTVMVEGRQVIISHESIAQYKANYHQRVVLNLPSDDILTIDKNILLFLNQPNAILIMSDINLLNIVDFSNAQFVRIFSCTAALPLLQTLTPEELTLLTLTEGKSDIRRFALLCTNAGLALFNCLKDDRYSLSFLLQLSVEQVDRAIDNHDQVIRFIKQKPLLAKFVLHNPSIISDLISCDDNKTFITTHNDNKTLDKFDPEVLRFILQNGLAGFMTKNQIIEQLYSSCSKISTEDIGKFHALFRCPQLLNYCLANAVHADASNRYALTTANSSHLLTSFYHRTGAQELDFLTTDRGQVILRQLSGGIILPADPAYLVLLRKFPNFIDIDPHELVANFPINEVSFFDPTTNISQWSTSDIHQYMKAPRQDVNIPLLVSACSYQEFINCCADPDYKRHKLNDDDDNLNLLELDDEVNLQEHSNVEPTSHSTPDFFAAVKIERTPEGIPTTKRLHEDPGNESSSQLNF